MLPRTWAAALVPDIEGALPQVELRLFVSSARTNRSRSTISLSGTSGTDANCSLSCRPTSVDLHNRHSGLALAVRGDNRQNRLLQLFRREKTETRP
ncbi:unnamed protein product, partial [Polarella glacialis]